MSGNAWIDGRNDRHISSLPRQKEQPKMTRIELSQDEDNRLRSHTSDGFVLRYASVRSSESRDRDQPNQDFVSFAIGSGSLTFAVCDGVGQSFYGDLAARFLGRRLQGWLENELDFLLNQENLAENLTAFLDGLTGQATEEVEAVAIPPDLPDLLREVLEEKRQLGSETTFACGRVELPRDDLPAGRLLLSWLGDVRLRLGEPHTWGKHVMEIAEGIPGRWSSARGLVRGALHLTLQPLASDDSTVLRNILVYTDGLKPLDKITEPLSDNDINDLIIKTSMSSQDDDYSILEIEIGDRIA